MNVSTFEMASVTLHELRTTAVTLLGTPAHQLPVTIELKDVNAFLRDNINTYWKTWLAKHSSLFGRQLLLAFFPRLTEWTVLGLARQLYTLRTGKIASKTYAGYYCLEQLPDNYHRIIRDAIKIRNDK